MKHLFNSVNESELLNLAKFKKIIMCHFNETYEISHQGNSARSKNCARSKNSARSKNK